MPLLENELARRRTPWELSQTRGHSRGGAADSVDALELRAAPLRVRWSFDDFQSADGHGLHCAFAASVRALPEPAEKRMLQEMLMSAAPAVNANDIERHFELTLSDAGARAALARGVEAWLADGAAKDLSDALRQAAERVAFACGLEVLAPFEIELRSPTYQQQRAREMQRSLAEQEATGQVEHFQRAAELLKQFQSLRESTPELSAGAVLDQIRVADRGSMLQTLLMASAQGAAATTLWAVAGPYLIQVDVAQAAQPRTELVPLPPTLGPTRSVQSANIEGRRALLVGCRGGFMVVWPDSIEEPELYFGPPIESQLGYSTVAYGGLESGFVACHGDAGIVRWALGQTDAPAAVLSPLEFPQSVASADTASQAMTMVGSISAMGLGAARAAGPRNATFVDPHHVLFSVGSRAYLLAESRTTELPEQSSASIVAIVPEARRALLIHEDGVIVAVDRASHSIVDRQARAGRCRAAAALPWLDGARLLIAGQVGPIQCLSLDDALVTQYASAHHSLAGLSASAAVVVAISSDRQRLILWNTWDGRQPVGEVYLTGLTRHRVADVAFE